MNKLIQAEALVKCERMFKSVQTIEQFDTACRYYDLATKGLFFKNVYWDLYRSKTDALVRIDPERGMKAVGQRFRDQAAVFSMIPFI